MKRDTSDRSPAFYALHPGRWRDYITLLHPPYTLWHLSYVCMGWATSEQVHTDRLVLLLAAFFLAVGIGAHALDELRGRPLNTAIPTLVLVAAAALAIGGAVAIGVFEAARTSWSILWFVVIGGFIVLAYNLELFRGAFHSDVWFALAWGAFPALTASWANTLSFSVPGVLVAGACFALSLAQRALSTPVRELRRRVKSVHGVLEYTDGTAGHIDETHLRAGPEAALKAMSAGLPLLSVALVALRL
jgi:hypothetical protein